MSKQTPDCPQELNESIKTEILAKANYQNSEAVNGKGFRWVGSALTILATLSLGAINVFTETTFGWDTIALIYALPVIWMGFGFGSLYYEKHHWDHDFHAVADKIRQERSTKRSFCAQRIMEHYSTPVTN